MELQTATLAGSTLALIVAAAAVRALRIRSRRTQLDASNLLIGEAMDKLHLTPADAGAAGAENELRQAVKLCAQCVDQDACRDWLMKGESRHAPEFCPNARLMDGLAIARSAAQSAQSNTPAWVQATPGGERL
ncbi:MAG: hypothetical protein KGI35_12460 [Burkholderiales bacterium]|nr:hypothetical protein [Burkholderiales bacterium]